VSKYKAGKLTVATRNQTYAEVCDELKSIKGVRRAVLTSFFKCAYQSRAELSASTGCAISSLCSALKSLEQLGYVHAAFDQLDPKTNRMVAVYTPTAVGDALYSDEVQGQWAMEADDA